MMRRIVKLTFPLHNVVWRELSSKKAKLSFLYLSAIGIIYGQIVGRQLNKWLKAKLQEGNASWPTTSPSSSSAPTTT